MDDFEKMKREFDEKLEQARSKVEERVDSGHASQAQDIRSRARERLAAMKSGKKKPLGGISGVGARNQASGNDATIIAEGNDLPTQRVEPQDDATVIMESETSPAEINDSDEDTLWFVEQNALVQESYGEITLIEERDTVLGETGSTPDDIATLAPLDATILAPIDAGNTRIMERDASPDFVEEGLNPIQRHRIDRAFAHLMHSIVKMCFYNLKVFCPSMIDEFDDEVEKQVAENLDRLDNVKVEVDLFFAQPVSGDRCVDGYFGEVAENVRRELVFLSDLRHATLGRLGEEEVRTQLAQEVPERIDRVTELLQVIRTELNASKCEVKSLLEEAVALHADSSGLSIDLEVGGCPRIFGNERNLVNAFAELISNASKYSGGERLEIRADHHAETQMIEIVFSDDGKGMTEEELNHCFERGFTTGGTGEGLAMVAEHIEVGHLGSIRANSKVGNGVQFTIFLPVIFQSQTSTQD